MIYLDTSVLVSYYCPEPNSNVVEGILLQAEQPVISPLTELELTSAVSRKIRERTLSQVDGNRILITFQSHLMQNFFLRLPVQTEHFHMAQQWIAQFPPSLRTLDALHLSLAASQNSTLYTSDTKLSQAGEHFGVDTFLIG